MKKYLLLILVTCIGIVSSCQYDDDELWGSVDDLANRVSALETLTQQMNGDIAALQAVITAVENRVAISEVEKLTDGYILHFTNGTTATIKHGKDGADGKDGQDGTAGADGEDGKDGADGADGKDGKDGKDAPYIYIAKDNGVYYWTLTVDGKTDWLTDEAGNKIPVTGAAGADGEDGKDGADGEDGKDAPAGSDGKDGRTPTLRINAQGEWEVSYDGTNYTKVAGAANAVTSLKQGDPGKASIFQSVTATEGAVIITMKDGNEYTVLRLKDGLRFYSDDKLENPVQPKEMTWKSGFTTGKFYFTLDLNNPEFEVKAEEFEVNVDTTDNFVELTLLDGTKAAKARAVILFFNKQRTLTSVFKFKHFEVDPTGNIAAVNTVLDMLGTTEELNVQIPKLDATSTNADGNGGVVKVPVVEGATQEGTGTNLTLNFTDKVTTSPEKPLVIKQEAPASTPVQEGVSVNNVNLNFSNKVEYIDLQTPNSSVTLTGGQTLTDVTALTGENTLYVDSVEINNLKVKGGNIHIYPEGYIKGHLKNESDKTITIYLEPGATVEKNLPNGFQPETEDFVIVYVSPKLYIKNKEFAYALSREYPENVTLNKKEYAEFEEAWAQTITSLNFSFKNYTISSLEGIEHFKNLTYLKAYQVGLVECDLSQNTKLEQVGLNLNDSLKVLDLSQNTELKEISASYTGLKSLDLSNNPKMTFVNVCGNKEMTGLNVKGCTELTNVWVSETGLKELDLSGCSKLIELQCDLNEALTAINLTGCSSLVTFTCQNSESLSKLVYDNLSALTDLKYGHTQISLTKSQLEQLTQVTTLGCAGRYSDTGVLDIPDAMKARLVYLECQNNNLNALDLSEYPNLVVLQCYWNNLTELNANAAPHLQTLRCFSNRIDSLNVSTLTKLSSLDCGNHQTGEDVDVYISIGQNQKWNSQWVNGDYNKGIVVHAIPVTLEECAKYGGTYTMTDRIWAEAPLIVEGELVLNMNGHIYSGPLFISDYQDPEQWKTYMVVKPGASLTINAGQGDAQLNSGQCLELLSSIRMVGGDSNAKSKVVINGGWICGTYYGIVVDEDCPDAEIVINDGLIEGDWNNAFNGVGIFNPGQAKVTVNGGTVKGHGSAIEMQGGELHITDGQFIAKQSEFGEGTTPEIGNVLRGAAIVVSPRTDVKVNITGGTFADDNCASALYFTAGGTEPNTSISISGGIFNRRLYSDGPSRFISGGRFKVKPNDNYIKDGKIAVQNGSYYEIVSGTSGGSTSLPSWDKDNLGNN